MEAKQAEANPEAGSGAKEASGEGRGDENACGGARRHDDNFFCHHAVSPLPMPIF